MKTLLLSAVAAVGLALGVAPQNASAAWVTRVAYHWDAHCRRYVACEERVWVPDCDDHHHHGSSAYYRGYDRYAPRTYSDRSSYPDYSLGRDRIPLPYRR